MERNLAIELIDFLYDSPSACHGVKATQRILNENGFIEIKEEDKWDLKSRQKYEVANYDTYDIDFDDEEVEPITEDGFDSYDTEMDYKEDDTDKDENDDFVDEEEAEDDYSDESNAEVGEDSDEFEGLAIYHEDEME